MKHLLIPILTAITLSALLPGCKTTEENYRSAYEKALEKRNEGLTQQEITAFAREEATPKNLFHGDSIPLKSEYVKCIEGGINGNVLEYNIVVAKFKQKFNATSVYKRLINAGYPKASLLLDREENYIVGATTDSTLQSAVENLKTIQTASPLPLRPPFPYILRKP